MKYTPYEQHCRDNFTQAYKFFMDNIEPRTDEQWAKILVAHTENCKNGGPFLRELSEACLAELEREYLEQGDVTCLTECT